MSSERPPADANYVMAHAEHDAELARLRKLEGIRDADTRHFIDAVGVGERWRCVDIGAGAGSVARHLAQVVGPQGHVMAADIDPRFLDDFSGPGHSVARHDITTGPVDPADFDFAHCRAVLTHVGDLEAGFANMAASVRPGGWVLCEEPDYISMEACDPEHPHANDLNTFRAIMTHNGRQDAFIGRKLHGQFVKHGFEAIQAEGRTALVAGGSPVAQFRIDGMHNARDLLIASGFFDNAAIDRLIQMFSDPTFAYLELTWIATWGRRPNG